MNVTRPRGVHFQDSEGVFPLVEAIRPSSTCRLQSTSEDATFELLVGCLEV